MNMVEAFRARWTGALCALTLAWVAAGADPAWAQGGKEGKPAAKPAAMLTTTAPAPTAAALRNIASEAAACNKCHEPVKKFRDEGRHQAVGCGSCHGKLAEHNANEKTRPTTDMSPAACGSCHKPQFDSQFTMNWHKTARKEKSLATGPSPNPSWDKLMAPHGFTREHAEARSHMHMVLDQFVVDRAFGGRFQPKEGWEYLAKTGAYKVWDVIEDKYPNDTDQKVFKPGTAAAANPVCWSCKSADLILDWAYMGDPVPTAKWSRTSKVVELVKDVNHAMNCFFCHDPHSAKPRVVRDGLIDALTRPEADTLFHQDRRAAKINVVDLGTRGHVRKIATLSRYDTKLQCGQCHVEYNCNPGFDPTTGQPIGMADRRTNHFPFKNVEGTLEHYTKIKFRDFRHAITGAGLIKSQHPDTENFYGSKHQRAGVECHDCHMPKVIDAKTKKPYTLHWQTSPKNYIKQTCLTCHDTWSEQQAKYAIESLQARIQGKTRKAEYWLTRMVDKFEEAKGLGVEEAVLAQVRDKHTVAHQHWEWWTASNGHWFHNPDGTTDSLAKSMAASQEGIKLLDDAMAGRRTASRTPGAAGAGGGAAAPAAVPAPAAAASR
jgi:formate-dependent nitrite reductase cytochrome c552 subunit